MSIQLHYATARAALSLVQHVVPKYAHSTLQLQRIATAVDVAMLAWNYKEVHDESYGIKRPVLMTGIIVTTAGVLSALALTLLSRGQSPDLYKLVTLSPGMSLRWTVPTLQKVMQWIALNRVFLNLYLALNEPHLYRRRLLVAGLQGVTFLNLNMLRWIQVQKPVSFQNVIDPSLTYQGYAAAEFFVPADRDNVKEMVQGACDYVNTALERPYLKWETVKGMFENLTAEVVAPNLQVFSNSAQAILEQFYGQTCVRSPTGQITNIAKLIIIPGRRLFPR